MMKQILFAVIAAVMSNFVSAAENFTVPAYAWVVGPQKDVRVSVYHVVRGGDYVRYFTEITDSAGSRAYADQIDCVEKTAKTVPVMHVGPDGEVLYSRDLDEVRRKLKDAAWNHIVANTLGEQIYETLCKNSEQEK